MSKKPASLKVHQLAKELGVSSKDIVTRCQQEEIPDIVNHLSPVSVGLALTVREWFKNAGGGSGEAAASGEAAEEGSATASVASTAMSSTTMSSTTGSSTTGSSTTGSSTTGSSTTLAPAKKAGPKKAAAGKTSDTAEQAGAESGSATDASVAAEPSAPRRAKRKPASESGAGEEIAPSQHAEPALAAEQAHAAPATPAPTASAEAPAVAPQGAAESKAAAAPEQVAVVAPAPARTAAQRIPAGLTARPTARADAPAAPAKPAESVQQVAARRVITAPPPPPQSLTDTSGPPPVMNVPKRPSIVGPVGPQLGALEKTKLSGPQVVRVEKADNLPAPPPMRRTGPGAGPTGPAGRGGRVGTGGRPEVRGRGGIGSSRTGRAGDSARQAYGAQDIRDRQQRLASSRGFMSSHQSMRGGGLGGGGGQRAERKPGEIQQVHVAEPLTIKELSAATGIKTSDIIKKLFLGGTMATLNSAIDREKAIEIMMDFDIDLIVEEAKSAAEIIEERFKDRERVDERRRAPIVTILGHVDHGKTSLLDRIRSTNIAAGEAGGITQSTRAFSVPVKAGNVDRVVTFIDTPGHEAFTSMRARGAKVTDIVVLVVSAVDGVMPQTIESINHAKAAGVPIVVAMNKIDRPDATEANIRRLLGQLAEHELNPVEWGGTTEVIRTSATRGDGIQELLEMLDYQAELLELKADFGGMARGTVLEASIEEGRGPVARVMVQEGRLKKGDFIVIGRGYGRVRDIINDRGERVTEAFPSTPVAISGIDELPDAGDKAFVVESIRAAEEAAEERRRIDRERELAAPKITLDNIFKHLEKAGRKELALVVKGDVQGSVEALKAMLAKLPTEEVVVSVKSASAGGINESDVTLAEATKAIIVGFNVTSSGKARQMAESKGIEIRLYEVIYDLIDDVTKAARGLLAPELKLEVLGHAEVRQVFKISKVGAIAGCYVTDGVVERNAQIRVTRDGIVVEKDRRLEQLKRFKDDAKEVRAGNECGMKIVGYDDIKVGDVLECYKTVTVQRS
ncbi:MAG: translation initiation factor IF-2 [Phycisphaera sp.]|nr:translation initiation factor IF-2 [Phycisphaera sp.]